MKNKKIQLIIKILIPVVIVGACFGIEQGVSVYTQHSFDDPVVINVDESIMDDDEGLEIESKESYGDIPGLTGCFGFINDDEALISIGLNRDEFYKKYPNELENNEDEKLINNMVKDYYGKMYVVNLKDFTKKPLGIEQTYVSSGLIHGVNKFSYFDKYKFFIYDLNNNSQKEYMDFEEIYNNSPEDQMGTECMMVWSEDGNCLISYQYQKSSLVIFNIKENTLKSFRINDNNQRITTTPSYYSDDGKSIYFIGESCKDDAFDKSIFKLDTESGSINAVCTLPKSKSSEEKEQLSAIWGTDDYCVMDNGKRIIFNGVIKGVEGTFIYDVDNDTFYNVIPHSVKGEGNTYYTNIWISPDKKKIIYKTLSEEDGKQCWNLYAAKINGNSLTHRMCIYKDIKLCGRDLTWSSDSKKILFFTGNEELKKNSFTFTDKSEVNIITFK